MEENKYTLAIYGIQDKTDTSYPDLVHDHAICVYHDGTIKHYLHLERRTRKKYDHRLFETIHELLKEKKMLKKDVDLIFTDNIVGRSFISKGGKIRFEAPLNETLKACPEEGFCWWYGAKKKAWIINHELAHIGSCLPFFGSFKEKSLLVHFDGGASKSSFSAWKYDQGQISLIEDSWEFKTLTGFYDSNALSFMILNGNPKNQHGLAGKLMGYAAFGIYSQDIERWLLQNDYFQNIWKCKKVFFEKMHYDWNIKMNQIDLRNNFIQNIVTTMQFIFEREVHKKIIFLKESHHLDFLYYSGGGALNIKLNTKLITDGDFKDVYIPPCPGDSGLSIGAGAFMEMMKNNTLKTATPYLNNWCIGEYETHYTKGTIQEVVKMLIEGKVIGICNGYGEAGPRALGNRSIIALASSEQLAQKINMDIKKREWYRPLAPVMLEKNAHYFTGLKNIHHLSKYMLLDFDILPQRKKEISGAVHVDETARIQTIFDKNDNPFMYDILCLLDHQYNVKALINTSFNNMGNPMVHTTYDAMHTALKTGLDAVVLNGKLHKL